VEHRKADLGDAAGRATAPDDAAQFLRELRQLRDETGLGQAELAARAHYPLDLILAAEAGPGLPDLPVLSAYVRACDGTTEAWEERWRSLTKSPAFSDLPTRLAGESPAADAGARIGSTTPITDADPSAIIAALSRVAEEMAGSKPAVLPSGPAAEALASRPVAPAVPTAAPAVPTRPAAPAGPAGPADDLFSVPKASGWDPIRVSSAWPALRETGASERATALPDRAPATGPWGAAPKAGSPGPSRSSGPAGPAGSSGSVAASGHSDGAARAHRIRVVAAVAVLVCVIVVLLAIFA
jgi:Helix-turn-helix domain